MGPETWLEWFCRASWILQWKSFAWFTWQWGAPKSVRVSKGLGWLGTREGGSKQRAPKLTQVRGKWSCIRVMAVKEEMDMRWNIRDWGTKWKEHNMITSLGSWCLGKCWCHLPTRKSQKKGLAWRKRGEEFAWRHAHLGITACLCGNVPGMQYQKCPLLRRWPDLGGWGKKGNLRVTNFMICHFNTKLKLPLAGPNSCTTNYF